jgi:hypothetical protein
MNAFDAGRAIEQRSNEVLLPWLGSRCADGRYVLTTKGRLAKELQKSVGDIVFNPSVAPDTVVTAEVKAEQTNAYGNVFLEIWSNLSRFTPGWLYTLNADLLLYHFLDEDELFVFHFQRLKRWAFTPDGNGGVPLYRFPVKRQSKYNQLNDTWGACVPLARIPPNALIEHVRCLSGEPATETTEDFGW